MYNCVRTKWKAAGIFLGNIYKYQNDHSDKFGGVILAQQGGFLTVPCLLVLLDISSAGMAPWCWVQGTISNFRGLIPHPAGLGISLKAPYLLFYFYLGLGLPLSDFLRLLEEFGV